MDGRVNQSGAGDHHVETIGPPAKRPDGISAQPHAFTPIDITDEEWIAAGQACGGLEIDRLRTTRTDC